MSRTPRPVRSILHANNNALGTLHRRAAFLLKIESVLQSIWPAQAVNHVHVAGYDQGCLRLVADSGAWATRLRYQQDGIRRILAQHLRMAVDDIQIRVRPAVRQLPPLARPRRVISARSRKLLQDSARYLPDPALADALQRLANCRS